MKQLKYSMVAGSIFVLAAGALAHFLYQWTGENSFVGLLTPINESIWEHMKLVFFPMLFFAVFIIFKCKRGYPCIVSSMYMGIVTGTLLIPVFFYTYTKLLGKDIFILDLGTFVLSTIIAFFAAYKFALVPKMQSYTRIFGSLVCLLLLSFLFFTYYPPNLEIFADPTIS